MPQKPKYGLEIKLCFIKFNLHHFIIADNPCLPNPCQNNATCYTSYNREIKNFDQSYQCACSKYFWGEKCVHTFSNNSNGCLTALDGSFTGPNCTVVLKLYFSNNFHWVDTGDKPGYSYTNVRFKILTVPLYNLTRVFYECTVNWSFNFISNDPNCEGTTFIKTLGYLYTKQLANTKPLYRCQERRKNNHWVDDTGCVCSVCSNEGLYGYYLVD